METTKQRLTRRLKPVTPEREMAIALLERASSPRWSTIIIEMISNMYCDRATATIGPAKEPNLLSSSMKVAHVRDDGFVSDLLLPSSCIPFANKLSSMSLSISVSWNSLVSTASLAKAWNKRDRERRKCLELLDFGGIYHFVGYVCLWN